jgi:heat shock protein HtpX
MQWSGTHKRLSRNRLQTLVILLAMAGLLAGAGALVAGGAGALWALVLGVAFALFAPRAPTAVLMNSSGARALSREEAPRLIGLVEELSERAGIARVPTVYLSPRPEINAFALGWGDDVAVGVTHGALEVLELDELAGVLAHEIAHIRHGDVFLMMLADVFSRMTNAMATVGKLAFLIALPLVLMGVVEVAWISLVVLITAPLVSVLLRFALSRSREHDADATAARLTGDPKALARALVKIERQSLNPLRLAFGIRPPTESPELLRSHPHTRDRVLELIHMEVDADAPRLAALERVARPIPSPTRYTFRMPFLMRVV